VLASRSLDRGRSVTAVLTDQMQHIDPVQLPAFPIRVPMLAPAKAQMEQSKDNVHNNPVCLLAGLLWGNSLARGLSLGNHSSDRRKSAFWIPKDAEIQPGY
jgi:hypothetical protein